MPSGPAHVMSTRQSGVMVRVWPFQARPPQAGPFQELAPHTRTLVTHTLKDQNESDESWLGIPITCHSK